MSITKHQIFRPLDINEIKQMIGNKANILTYEDLQQSNNIHTFFINKCCIILLKLKGREKETGHFISLINHGNYIEHFDPYGLSVDEETLITHNNHLEKLIVKYNYIESKFRYQKFLNDINTCGRWCVVRCLLSTLNHVEFE